jgi:hypothetical protein
VTLDNYPLSFESIPFRKTDNILSDDEDECVLGGEHDPVVETDDYPEFQNGHLINRRVSWAHCNKCGEEVPMPEPPEPPDRLEEA